MGSGGINKAYLIITATKVVIGFVEYDDKNKCYKSFIRAYGQKNYINFGGYASIDKQVGTSMSFDDAMKDVVTALE